MFNNLAAPAAVLLRCCAAVLLGCEAAHLVQVEQRQAHADDVDDDPQQVEDVVSERAVHQRAGGRVVARLRVSGERPAQERGAQVDRDRGEPDHEHAEQHALQENTHTDSPTHASTSQTLLLLKMKMYAPHG